MPTVFLVGVGAALGGMARFGLGGALEALLGGGFPWSTLLINIIGSFVIGLFATLIGPEGRLMIPGSWRQFVMTGLCGGFTTFSSFSLQTVSLWQAGQGLAAAGNAALSVLLCLVGVWGGFALAQRANAPRRA